MINDTIQQYVNELLIKLLNKGFIVSYNKSRSSESHYISFGSRRDQVIRISDHNTSYRRFKYNVLFCELPKGNWYNTLYFKPTETKLLLKRLK